MMRVNSKWIRAFVLLTAGALFGCSGAKDVSVAEEAVTQFHALLDSGQFVEIYQLSSDELKRVSKQNDFVALLDAIHRKLGNTKSAVRQNWLINYHTSGTFITLTYHTVFGEDEAAEQFVYRIENGAASLTGYHINSNALIVK
jgi:hypothetical protein